MEITVLNDFVIKVDPVPMFCRKYIAGRNQCVAYGDCVNKFSTLCSTAIIEVNGASDSLSVIN